MSHATVATIVGVVGCQIVVRPRWSVKKRDISQYFLSHSKIQTIIYFLASLSLSRKNDNGQISFTTSLYTSELKAKLCQAFPKADGERAWQLAHQMNKRRQVP